MKGDCFICVVGLKRKEGKDYVKRLDFPINPGHINCNFYALVNVPKKQVNLIGRVGRIVLFLKQKPNVVIFLSELIDDLRKEKGVFKGPEKELIKVKWRDPTKEREILFTAYDFAKENNSNIQKKETECKINFSF